MPTFVKAGGITGCRDAIIDDKVGNITSLTLKSSNIPQVIILKRKKCDNANFVNTGGTTGCHNDNLLWTLWTKLASWQL